MILIVIETGHLGIIVINYLQYMIEQKYELDMYPMVKNRSIVQLVPTQLYADWFNYTRNDGINYSIDKLESISFLINDFDTRMEFNDWLESNFNLLFDIRLNYSCVDKSLWPEDRSFGVFNKWFEIRYSNLIIDLKVEPIILV